MLFEVDLIFLFCIDWGITETSQQQSIYKDLDSCQENAGMTWAVDRLIFYSCLLY
jgi:hypothetical protein